MLAGHPLASWLIFAGTVALLLAIDLGVLSRRPAVPTVRSAGWWSAAVIIVAAAFGVIIWLRAGRHDAIDFATAYLIELALSIDNLLVFILVMRYFAVPETLQPAVLKWGILGAIVMRGAVIITGTLVLREVHWILYLLGGLLVVTGLRMLGRDDQAPPDPSRNLLLRLMRRLLPITDQFEGEAMLIRRGGRLMATPLLAVIVVVEWTDLVFAGDSIPAIFGVTRDPFLIYTSNVLAVIGLRALFFVLAAMLVRYAYLRTGIAILLVLVGAKMLASRWVTVPSWLSLAGILVVLAATLLASWWQQRVTTRA
jgi:tellurite resistance protein TerC